MKNCASRKKCSETHIPCNHWREDNQLTTQSVHHDLWTDTVGEVSKNGTQDNTTIALQGRVRVNERNSCVCTSCKACVQTNVRRKPNTFQKKKRALTPTNTQSCIDTRQEKQRRKTKRQKEKLSLCSSSFSLFSHFSLSFPLL